MFGNTKTQTKKAKMEKEFKKMNKEEIKEVKESLKSRFNLVVSEEEIKETQNYYNKIEETLYNNINNKDNVLIDEQIEKALEYKCDNPIIINKMSKEMLNKCDKIKKIEGILNESGHLIERLNIK